MLEVIKNRRSTRSFTNQMVPKETIDEIIEAGLYAANGKNFQYGIVIAITNKETRDKLSILNHRIGGYDKVFDPFYGAPVILLVAVKKWDNSKYDGAAMIENMLLEAENQGLATCWINRARQELELEEGRELFKSLDIDLTEYEGVGHVALGYSNSPKKDKIIKENRVYYI